MNCTSILQAYLYNLRGIAQHYNSEQQANKQIASVKITSIQQQNTYTYKI